MMDDTCEICGSPSARYQGEYETGVVAPDGGRERLSFYAHDNCVTGHPEKIEAGDEPPEEHGCLLYASGDSNDI